MGVVFARFADDDRIIAIAKNSERNLATRTRRRDPDRRGSGDPREGRDRR